MSDMRSEAEQCLKQGVASIGAAFDLCNARRWQFNSDVQKCAEALLLDMVRLFHENQVRQKQQRIASPADRQQAHEASVDVDFQRFLSRLAG